MWSTGSLHVVSMWSTGSLHVVYRWSTGGLHVVSMWSTCGLQVVYMWSTGGLQVVYMWSTGGLQVVSRWSPGPHLAALHHGRQQTHVELWSRGPDVVLGSHELYVLSAGKIRAERHYTHTHTHTHTHKIHFNKNITVMKRRRRRRRRRRRSLTGDVAVVVGAVVVLQEGNQRVQEVVRTQQNEFLQHVWMSRDTRARNVKRK